MIERIREIIAETNWLLEQIIGYDIETELAINYLTATLEDLEASSGPTDEQIEIVFIALSDLQRCLLKCQKQTSVHFQILLENLIDRIDIFLFHHRL